MKTLLNIIESLFRGIFIVIESVLSGIASIISKYPKFFGGIILLVGFMFFLQYFGDMAAQIMAFMLILAALKVLFKKK